MTEQTGESAAPAAALRVLVVEDDAEMVAYLETQLTGAELVAGRTTEVVTADDLGRARAALDEGHVDLVVLDPGLGDSTGLDTVFGVTQASPATPVVVLTGSTDADLAEQVLLAGAQDLLVKGGFAGDDLVRLLRRTLARHRHTLELLTAAAHAADEPLTRLEALGGPGVGVASRSLGRVSLSETYPEAFRSAAATYAELVPARLEERGLHVDYHVSSRVRAVAWDLGRLRATPRDVVDVHVAALRGLTDGRPPARTGALLRAGEGLLTEALGHLASFYRSQVMGQRPERPATASTDSAEEQEASR